jgi:ribose transport system substrate-binding protein
MSVTRRRLWRPLIAAVAVCAALAACSAGPGGAAGAGRATAAPNDPTLAPFYAGEVRRPAAAPVPAKRGATVWMISCGQKFPVCATLADEFTDAGAALGWNTNVYDGAGNPDTATTGIRQAIAAGADAVMTIAFDCAGIKNGLKAAKEANVLTVNYVGVDCPDEPLFTSSAKVFGSTDIRDFTAQRGTKAAEFVVAAMKARGIENGKVVAIQSVGQLHHAAYWKAWRETMTATCPGCPIVPVEFSNAQLPNPAKQIWTTALVANPDAAAVVYNSDTYISSGLASAVAQAGLTRAVVCCGGGEEPAQLTNGQVTAVEYWPYALDTWGAIDGLNRLLSGTPAAALPDQGGAIVFADAEHNLKDGRIELPFDFRGTYRSGWAAAS